MKKFNDFEDSKYNQVIIDEMIKVNLSLFCELHTYLSLVTLLKIIDRVKKMMC